MSDASEKVKPKTIKAADLKVGDCVVSLGGSNIEILSVRPDGDAEYPCIYYSWRYRRKGSNEVGCLQHSGYIAKPDQEFGLQEDPTEEVNSQS